MDSLGSLHGTQIPNNHLRNDTQVNYKKKLNELKCLSSLIEI